MKTILTFGLSFLLALTAFTQSIKVKVNGNQQVQVVLDGVSYDASNYANNEIGLNSLTAGKHEMVIYRINNRGVAKQIYSSTILLDSGKEILLTVGANGSISREEYASNEAYGRSPMTESSFNELYSRIRARWGQSSKLSAARDAFNTNGNYFSTAQAARIIQLINTEAGRLELAKLSYDNIIDPDNFEQISNLLVSQASRNELETYVDGLGTGGYRAAMSATSYNQLYNSVSAKKAAVRMTTLRNTFNTAGNYFNVEQVKQLITLITNESQRLQLAKLSLDNIIDMQNVELLFQLFNKQSSKDDLDLYIRDNNYADSDYTYTSKAAMSDANFNSIYEIIKSKWLPGSKYSAATDAFNTATNYFTTAQVKKIINLLSSESNRMELAKIAFDNTVDPQNFRDIYDLFSTASQNELDSWLKSNGH